MKLHAFAAAWLQAGAGEQVGMAGIQSAVAEPGKVRVNRHGAGGVAHLAYLPQLQAAGEPEHQIAELYRAAAAGPVMIGQLGQFFFCARQGGRQAGVGIIAGVLVGQLHAVWQACRGNPDSYQVRLLHRQGGGQLPVRLRSGQAAGVPQIQQRNHQGQAAQGPPQGHGQHAGYDQQRQGQ